MSNLLRSFRFALITGQPFRPVSTASSPLCFHLTQVVEREPLKKKKGIDPQVIRAREERRRKRIEKQIRILEKSQGQLKPIDEYENAIKLEKNNEAHLRMPVPISEEEEDRRIQLYREWCMYKKKQKEDHMAIIHRVQKSRQKALEELRQASEELWLEAIQQDIRLLPYRVKGPVRTPPIENYAPPDGEYIDISRKWE